MNFFLFCSVICRYYICICLHGAYGVMENAYISTADFKEPNDQGSVMRNRCCKFLPVCQFEKLGVELSAEIWRLPVLLQLRTMG